MCCHTDIEGADQTCYLTKSQYTDTGPTSPHADPVTPGRVATGVPVLITGITRLGQSSMDKAGIKYRTAALDVEVLPLVQKGGLEQGPATDALGPRTWPAVMTTGQCWCQLEVSSACTSRPSLPSATVGFISRGHWRRCFNSVLMSCAVGLVLHFTQCWCWSTGRWDLLLLD